MRLLLLFFVLAVFFLAPFLLWGDMIEACFSQEALVGWLQNKASWAWLVAILLLLADLLLPIPATVIIAALGIVYGPLLGGLIGTVGAVAAGLLGYGLCRLLGQPVALIILGQQGLAQGQRLFFNIGGWLVALSKWLPIFPEVIACMAGLIRMPFPVFAAALLCGSAPFAFIFATVGYMGRDYPLLTLLISLCVPLLLWLLLKPGYREQ